MNQDNNPNGFDDQNVNATANSQQNNQDTGTDHTAKASQDAEPNIDYKTKFAESSKEALRLFEENKALKAQTEELTAKGESVPSQNLYPGFDELDEDAKNNLIAYTDTITNRVKEDFMKDPAISYARTAYNEKVWNDSFAEISSKYPDLNSSKDEFKSKYFNPNNPINPQVMDDVAKIYLFDKARDIGASEERQKADRMDMERATGGDKTPQAGRSLEDWNRMAAENPAKFAQHSKEYQEDLASGKI